MARNEEKSMSMLFRFREAQASELGLSGRTDRRPRVASSCKDLRQCERWRGEILRDISRKVSKIQDFGLTDYEVRDLNDEINKLLREKHHWENQIIALGGANYKRAAGKMTDAGGKEVPGARGYKFVLPCPTPPLTNLSSSSTKTADETAELESYKTLKVDMFSNPPPGYSGDSDELDGLLIASERAAEAEAWEEALDHLREDLELAMPDPLPVLPEAAFISLDEPKEEEAVVVEEKVVGGKRKAPKAPAGGKKSKVDGMESANSANGFVSVLKGEDLRPPKLLGVKEMEAWIVSKQKAALLKEYLD
ncbi:pre-mRNA-splicing factor ISY1, partial [Phenoliferia sp. Uapishka_3]